MIDEEEKQLLLDSLIVDPAAGDIIKGSGGIRKLRWKAAGRGKRGGIRVIYYWQREAILYLFLAYPKNKMENLSADELAVLKKVVEEEKRTWTKNASGS